jgi:hypothetical protein
MPSHSEHPDFLDFEVHLVSPFYGVRNTISTVEVGGVAVPALTLVISIASPC